MEIRKANLNDLDELMVLYKGQGDYHLGLDADYYIESSEEGLAGDRKMLEETIRSGSEGLLVAVTDTGGLIGFVTFTEKTESYPDTKITKFGEVEELYVSPEARGLGAGKALLAAAESYFKNLGYDYMRLKSSVYNTSSHEFYKSQGYETRQVLMFKKF